MPPAEIASAGLRPKVFCLGLSRTGTTALAEKLASLGYRTIHYSLNAFVRINEVSAAPYQINCPKPSRYWEWAFSREVRSQDKATLEQILSAYDAFADLPFPLLYEEFSLRFPDARFVLTTRSEESWLRSMKWLLSEGHALWHHGLLDDSLLVAAYGDYKYDTDRLLEAYRRHNRRIRQHFSDSDRFLELTIEDGDFSSNKLDAFLATPAQHWGPLPKSNKSHKVAASSIRWHHLCRSSRLLHFYSILGRKLANATRARTPSAAPERATRPHALP